MGRRHPRFVCEGCKQAVDEFPEYHLCDYCAGQFRAIWRLYTTICEVREKARKLSPAQLMYTLWTTYKKSS